MRRVATFFAILCCSITLVQSAELPIGSLLLTLGAEKTAVMKEINARFYVVTVTGQPDTFLVSERKPPNVKVIGGVAFQNGRLSWVQRNWGHFDGKINSVEVSNALFSAIESASNSSGTGSITVSTKIQRVPGMEFKTTNFEFLDRKVTMTSTEGDTKHGEQQVSISESIKLKLQ